MITGTGRGNNKSLLWIHRPELIWFHCDITKYTKKLADKSIRAIGKDLRANLSNTTTRRTRLDRVEGANRTRSGCLQHQARRNDVTSQPLQSHHSPPLRCSRMYLPPTLELQNKWLISIQIQLNTECVQISMPAAQLDKRAWKLFIGFLSKIYVLRSLSKS